MISDIAAAAIDESFRSRRPMPKRGQIMLRMAANACYSIVSSVSRASSHHQHSSGKVMSGRPKAIETISPYQENYLMVTIAVALLLPIVILV